MSRLRVTASALNVRSGPTTNAGIVGRLSEGDVVETRPVPPVGPWRAIRTVTQGDGWAHGSYLAPMAEPKKPPAAKWRVAKSLDKLLSQINARAPKRKKTHDGSIGDTAHAARTSDHNPDANKVVRARDFTHDPAGGCDCDKLAESLRASRDQRIKYVIWRRRIFSSIDTPKGKAWQWRPYSGANPHDKHAHLSVVAEASLYDDERPWSI